jgi:hypothetical protein
MLFAIGSTFSCSQAQRDKTVSGMGVPPGFRASLLRASTRPCCVWRPYGFDPACRSSNHQHSCRIEGSHV